MVELIGVKRRVSFRRGTSFRRRRSSASSTISTGASSKKSEGQRQRRRHSDGGALIRRRSTSTTHEEWDIYVRTLCGRQFVIMVNPHDTMDAVRMKIRMKEGISEDQQRLLFKGRQLEEGTCLDWDLYDSCTICLTLRLRGG